MRHIQTTYWLEPAGSHGVWGLDDYQFLPFVWGSAQLTNHPLIRPKSIHNEELLGMYGNEYMYLTCVQFVKAVRTYSVMLLLLLLLSTETARLAQDVQVFCCILAFCWWRCMS